MKIEMMATEKLVPYENNPRKNTPAVKAVAASLKEFGFQQPLVVDKDLVVVIGHTRLLAAKDLGLKKVPVLVADSLTPEQTKAYRLIDNRSHELASWDLKALGDELAELRKCDIDALFECWDPGQIDALTAQPELPPSALPDYEGLDDRAGRFILVYETEEEKAAWCAKLGIDGGKVVYTVGECL